MGDLRRRQAVGQQLDDVPLASGSATLRLHAGSSREDRSLQVQRTPNSWSEASVNWNNQPVVVGPTSTTPVGPDAEDLEWSVGAQVLAAYDTGSVSFLVRDTVEGQDAEQQFQSREKGEDPPLLVIQFVKTTS